MLLTLANVSGCFAAAASGPTHQMGRFTSEEFAGGGDHDVRKQLTSDVIRPKCVGCE